MGDVDAQQVLVAAAHEVAQQQHGVPLVAAAHEVAMAEGVVNATLHGNTVQAVTASGEVAIAITDDMGGGPSEEMQFCDTAEEKRVKRMKRNRESAAQSRDR